MFFVRDIISENRPLFVVALIAILGLSACDMPEDPEQQGQQQDQQLGQQPTEQQDNSNY